MKSIKIKFGWTLCMTMALFFVYCASDAYPQFLGSLFPVYDLPKPQSIFLGSKLVVLQEKRIELTPDLARHFSVSKQALCLNRPSGESSQPHHKVTDVKK